MNRAQIILAIIFITFIVSLFYYKKFNVKPLKYFIYYIGYVFISETIANILQYHNKRAIILNNVFIIITTLFYLFFYVSLFTKQKFKRIIYFFITFFIFSVLVNSFAFQNFLDTEQIYTIEIGFFLVIITIILFFIEIMNSDKILVLNKLFVFWISIGVLIFDIGMIPVFFVGELINWTGIYNYIILPLNIIMYGCFIIGFVVSEKEYNK